MAVDAFAKIVNRVLVQVGRDGIVPDTRPGGVSEHHAPHWVAMQRRKPGIGEVVPPEAHRTTAVLDSRRTGLRDEVRILPDELDEASPADDLVVHPRPIPVPPCAAARRRRGHWRAATAPLQPKQGERQQLLPEHEAVQVDKGVL
eukprot:scaffold65059_cov65-Phaeocystis_antarctica.AAC.5